MNPNEELSSEARTLPQKHSYLDELLLFADSFDPNNPSLTQFEGTVMRAANEIRALKAQVDQMTRELKDKDRAYNQQMKRNLEYEEALTRDIQRKDEVLSFIQNASMLELARAQGVSEAARDNKEDVKDPQ